MTVWAINIPSLYELCRKMETPVLGAHGIDFAEAVKLIVGKTELSSEMPILLWIGTPQLFTSAIKHHRKGLSMSMRVWNRVDRHKLSPSTWTAVSVLSPVRRS